MSLSDEQIALEKKIKKSARTWGIVLGTIAGLITLSLVSGLNTFVWAGAGAAVGLAVGFGIFKWRYGANSGAAKCAKCSAAFSISRTDKVETLTGSVNEESREDIEGGATKVTTWTEEQYNVVETYTCSKCADETVKEYQTTRRKDEKEEVEQAPAPAKSEASQSKSGGASGKTAASSTKAGSSGEATSSKKDEAAPESERTGKGQRGGYT